MTTAAETSSGRVVPREDVTPRKRGRGHEQEECRGWRPSQLGGPQGIKSYCGGACGGGQDCVSWRPSFSEGFSAFALLLLL